MPDGETLYDRVDRAIQRGEVWRAKEILRGNIRVRGYDVDLYERYGRLLLDIGEMSEAGKYLFLSGRRSAEYEKATSLYLERHVPNPEHMYFSFPRAARLNDIDEYPEEVRRTLETFDFPVALDGRLYALRRWREHGAKMRAKQPDEGIYALPTATWRESLYWMLLRAVLFSRFRSRSAATYAEPLVAVRRRGRLETTITTLLSLFIMLFLLICLAVGVWVVVEWLAGWIL